MASAALLSLAFLLPTAHPCLDLSYPPLLLSRRPSTTHTHTHTPAHRAELFKDHHWSFYTQETSQDEPSDPWLLSHAPTSLLPPIRLQTCPSYIPTSFESFWLTNVTTSIASSTARIERFFLSCPESEVQAHVSGGLHSRSTKMY